MKSLVGVLLPFTTVILSLLGLTCFVVAGFLASTVVGFAIAGLSLLVLAYYAEAEQGST